MLRTVSESSLTAAGAQDTLDNINFNGEIGETEEKNQLTRGWRYISIENKKYQNVSKNQKAANQRWGRASYYPMRTGGQPIRALKSMEIYLIEAAAVKGLKMDLRYKWTIETGFKSKPLKNIYA